ncbi:hypothetical protein CEXT_40801 [Caerostris extrusa]|uniref:Uncharacterized protein n=1 Tax=Caerostris extrusa TaxID=172846 RepID=A0AAV4Y671_CAEEX|nr:hypothetical protein CEXT_40801 [Caerostris extrusa]
MDGKLTTRLHSIKESPKRFIHICSLKKDNPCLFNFTSSGKLLDFQKADVRYFPDGTDLTPSFCNTLRSGWENDKTVPFRYLEAFCLAFTTFLSAFLSPSKPLASSHYAVPEFNLSPQSSNIYVAIEIYKFLS